jgi:DNA-binding transcriptional MocR family regulator
MSDWAPSGELGTGPRYRAIVDALAADIEAGRIGAGTRLPPHRDLAERLGLSVGTVTRAYQEAETRGLVSGEVGRGTFVLAPPLSSAEEVPGRRTIDLGLNAPPPTGADELIGAVLAKIGGDRSIGRLLGYQPHQGLRRHREAVGGWLARHGMGVDAESVYLTHGAQHGLSVVLTLLARAGETVLTEALTYSGVVALAAHTGVVLQGVETDAEGIVPSALRAALRTTGARTVYLTPTLQTPTAGTLSMGRREEIADIIRREDAWLIEDDAYGFLPEPTPQPIAALIPERSFYVVSFAKCLAPGLRLGAMTAPPRFRDGVLNGLRATGWMATPLVAEALALLISDGSLARQAALKRESGRRRVALAASALGRHMRPQPLPSFHVWLPLPVGRTASSLVGQAAYAGVALSAPAVLRPLDSASAGIRLCLGGPRSEVELSTALRSLRAILEGGDDLSIV